jgi:hypothetical protein
MAQEEEEDGQYSVISQVVCHRQNLILYDNVLLGPDYPTPKCKVM